LCGARGKFQSSDKTSSVAIKRNQKGKVRSEGPLKVDLGEKSKLRKVKTEGNEKVGSRNLKKAGELKGRKNLGGF